MALLSVDPITNALRATPKASPELLQARALLRRTDTKFVTDVARIPAVLERVGGAYAALWVPGGPIATYRSLYFDSPDLRCFHDHRRSRRLRHKARVRHYPDRGQTFFEVKSKRNDLVTTKHRIEVPYGVERPTEAVLEFLREQLGNLACDLVPTAYVHYRRISLLGVDVNERVTIDFDLEVSTPEGDRHDFGPVAIVEVKQPCLATTTPIMRALAAEGVKRRSLSKYVAAVAVTHPAVRRNRLLPSLRAIERI
ncbi:MAG: polyphosphate polymerase domain-containing protein [Myxococcales bacterium]|nr:polyphosphate polymerase domain-containing protein [Myxococcales bacterium]